MNESEKLKISLEMIKKNEISNAIYILKDSKNFYNLKLLGILLCISGDFKSSFSIFNKLSLEDLSVKKYLDFFTNVIEKEYLPLFNKMNDFFKKDFNKDKISSLLVNLEKIFPNAELYYISTIFYLNDNNIKKAYEKFNKLKNIDSSYKNIGELEIFFKNQKLKNKNKLYVISSSILLTLFLFSFNNIFTLKNQINLYKNDIINLQNKLTSKKQETPIIKKEEKILKVIENNFLNNSELYHLTLKRFKTNNFLDVIKISEKIDLSKLPEYKRKEIIFIKASSYENLNDKTNSLKYYKEFLENYNKIEYKQYIKIVHKRIKRLEKL